MFESVSGFIECCGCILVEWEQPFPSFSSRTKAIEHLEKHKLLGHSVPEYAIETLKSEIVEVGDTIPE